MFVSAFVRGFSCSSCLASVHRGVLASSVDPVSVVGVVTFLSTPPCGGTCFDPPGKNAGEVTLIGEAGDQRDFTERLICIEKQLLRSFDSLGK